MHASECLFFVTLKIDHLEKDTGPTNPSLIRTLSNLRLVFIQSILQNTQDLETCVYSKYQSDHLVT